MIKQIVALAATALFSMNASAGYVRYDLDYGSSDTGLEGFIVQHDTDQSIALFSFQLNDPSKGNGYFGQYFFPLDTEGCVCLVSASTRFRNSGPTNFSIEDGFGADHSTNLSVTFARATGGSFKYTAKYTADLYENQPPEYFTGTLSGFATRGTVDPLLASYLDSVGGYEVGVPRIIPTYIGPGQVPEPTSIALFALGAASLVSAARRRKAVK